MGRQERAADASKSWNERASDLLRIKRWNEDIQASLAVIKDSGEDIIEKENKNYKRHRNKHKTITYPCTYTEKET